MEAQTRSILQSRTDEITRGTPVYMAPEIHLGILKNATLADLKRTDIWSLGMLAYAIINPNLQHPYCKEAEKARGQLFDHTLKSFMKREQLPTHDTKYETHRITEWWQIEEIFNTCAKFEANERPAASKIAKDLNLDNPEASLNIKCCSISQNTALENADSEAQKRMQNCEASDVCEERPENDGTNACVFLALRICDFLMQIWNKEKQPISWEELVTNSEEIIKTFPSEINSLRDCSEKYDPASAKAILTSNNMLRGSYELSEECISNEGVFTQLGREELFHALTDTKLADLECCVGLYTCSPYSFLIGIYSGSFFLIDTHPVNEALGGNGNAILVYTRDRSVRSCKMLVQWIIKRLAVSGVNGETVQSVSWLTENRVEGNKIFL